RRGGPTGGGAVGRRNDERRAGALPCYGRAGGSGGDRRFSLYSAVAESTGRQLFNPIFVERDAACRSSGAQSWKDRSHFCLQFDDNARSGRFNSDSNARTGDELELRGRV